MRRPQPVVLLIVVAVILGLVAQVVPFYTDWLWFGEVGYAGVFWTILSLRGALFTAVAVGVLVFLWAILTFAARSAAPDVLWELEDQLGADEGVGMCIGVGDDLEGEIVKTVAGKDGGRFVERPVHRRLAAAQVVVVHAGEVVVDQRIDMDCLDRCAGSDDPILCQSEQPSGCHRQKRPEPLAAA